MMEASQSVYEGVALESLWAANVLYNFSVLCLELHSHDLNSNILIWPLCSEKKMTKAAKQ